MNTNKPPLLPCPRCGGDNLVSRLKGRQWQVVCATCGFGATFWYESAQLSVDYWNDETHRAVTIQRAEADDGGR